MMSTMFVFTLFKDKSFSNFVFSSLVSPWTYKHEVQSVTVALTINLPCKGFEAVYTPSGVYHGWLFVPCVLLQSGKEGSVRKEFTLSDHGGSTSKIDFCFS